MTQFIDPPPINEPLVKDASGVVRSPVWLRWFTSIADSLASGILDDSQATQSSQSVTSTTVTATIGPPSDLATFSVSCMDTQSTTTAPADPNDSLTLYWIS